MDQDFGSSDIVFQGWLTKSPPLETKKQLFKAVTPKWRRRWFVLQQGAMPAQFLLHYYTDHTARKLKGTIDLDQCEQVDTGLTFESGKTHYQYMFDIKTPKRVFYLAADTEEDMTRWVDYVCQVCGLRPYQQDSDDEPGVTTTPLQPITSQPGSQQQQQPTTISGPYMHLSECFTGGRLPPQPANTNPHPGLTMVSPPRISPHYVNKPDESLQSGDDSVFLHTSPPAVKTGARQSVGEDDLAGQVGQLTVSDSRTVGGQQQQQQEAGGFQPPGRPPKPANLRNVPVNYPTQPASDNYANHDEMATVALQHASAGHGGEAAEVPHGRGQAQDKYGETQSQETNNNVEPVTSSSICSVDPGATGTAANTSFPPTHPPVIDRKLKPDRKASVGLIETTMHPLTPGFAGPPVSRSLKPRVSDVSQASYQTNMVIPGSNNSKYGNVTMRRNSDSDNDCSGSDPGSRRNSEDEQIYFYMPPLHNSNTLGGKWDPIMIPAQEMLDQSVQYLDLDLPTASPETEATALQQKTRQTNTVYKTVDFLKTEAFNRTRQKVEEYRYNIKPDQPVKN